MISTPITPALRKTLRSAAALLVAAMFGAGCAQSQSEASMQRPNVEPETKEPGASPASPAPPDAQASPPPTVVVIPQPEPTPPEPAAEPRSAPDAAPPAAADPEKSTRPAVPEPPIIEEPEQELLSESDTDTDPESESESESGLPPYVRILSPLAIGAAYAAEVSSSAPASLAIRTQNVGRLLVTRRDLPVGRNRSIALRVDGFVFEWSAAHATLILEFTPSGGWRIAESR